MTREFRSIASYLAVLCLAQSAEVVAAALDAGCGEGLAPQIRVDTGHPWRPPFGVERVGAPLVAHVQIKARDAASSAYFLAAYRAGHEAERHELHLSTETNAEGGTLVRNATAPLESVPDEVALLCSVANGTKQLARQAVKWPQVEADAEARASEQINPVDLGAILVPHDYLLLTAGQEAVIDFAAISRSQSFPSARVRAWFDAGKGTEATVPLPLNKRTARQLRLPLSSNGDRAVLHVALTDGERELWKKDIRTMRVAQRPHWPAFGAVATKLRYDAPISVKDPKSGALLEPLSYATAWDAKLQDVVVFLPNGSRFVFWRGSSYAPFWAGRYNTGFSYQWAETIPPRGFVDAVEPLQDKELRYGRVQIIESTASRVHVRWTYQSVDFTYRSLGDEAAEDFYFYPDGFGTRVVTIASERPEDYVYSEFIIIAPQAQFPYDIQPEPRVDLLFLDGKKQELTFPAPAGTYQGLTLHPTPAQNQRIAQHVVERLLAKVLEYQGKNATASTVDLINHGLGKVVHQRHVPIVYRVADNRRDSSTPIYFSPFEANSSIVMLPFRDQGELVSPGYWGDHWPLGRGAMTGGAIDDRIYVSPSHISLMDLSEPEPIWSSESQMVDTLGHSRRMTLQRRAFLIGKTDAPDEELLARAASFSGPPALEVPGARTDFPSYAPERRAMRLRAEAADIAVRLKPEKWCVDPVFELADAPGDIVAVTLDGKPLTREAYAWDGATLWVKARIGAGGANLGLRFASTESH
jgi:hypothetical protein